MRYVQLAVKDNAGKVMTLTMVSKSNLGLVDRNQFFLKKIIKLQKQLTDTAIACTSICQMHASFKL